MIDMMTVSLAEGSHEHANAVRVAASCTNEDFTTPKVLKESRVVYHTQL